MFASNIQPVLVGSLNRYDAKFHEKIRARRLGVLGEGTSPPRGSIVGRCGFGECAEKKCLERGAGCST